MPNELSKFQFDVSAPQALLLSFTNVDVSAAEDVAEKLVKAISMSKYERNMALKFYAVNKRKCLEQANQSEWLSLLLKNDRPNCTGHEL